MQKMSKFERERQRALRRKARVKRMQNREKRKPYIWVVLGAVFAVVVLAAVIGMGVSMGVS